MIEEQYLARKYCEPKAYWHCMQELGEPSTSFLVLNELEGAGSAVQNDPEYWLDAVGICTKQEPSPAAKQLHRRVEAARAEFKRKQDKAWGAGGVDRATFDTKELSAWNTFNAQKQVHLKDYLRAMETGVVVRRRCDRKCKQCNAGTVMGRTKYCEVCAKQRHREAVRANKKQRRSLRVISLLSDSL